MLVNNRIWLIQSSPLFSARIHKRGPGGSPYELCGPQKVEVGQP